MKKLSLILIAVLFGTIVSAQTINSTNFSSLGTTPISSGDFGLKFTANTDTGIVSVTKHSQTTVTNSRIFGSDYSQLGVATFVGDTATFSTPIPVYQGNTYYVTINNGGSGFTTNYGDVATTLPANNTDLTFPLDGNAIFHAPYSETITSFTVGESSLGITGIITDVIATTTPPEATTTPPVIPPSPTTTPTIIYAGDSLTEAAAADYPYNYYLTLPSEYNQINLGVSGKYMAAINTDRDTILNPLYGSSTENVVIIWAGINDIFFGENALDTFNALKDFGQYEQSLGVKVIVLTTINHMTSFTEPIRNEYNTMIRNQWSTFADGIADVAANDNFGLSTSHTNPVYYADQVHLTNAGYELIAEIVQPVLDEVIGVTPTPEPTYTLTQTQITRLSEILTELQSIISSATIN